jgi:5-methylcytosine-specific restriction endonuclease McrA
MSKILSRFRADAFHRQEGRCYYCTAPMWHDDGSAFARAYGLSLKVARWLQCTAEHLKARINGGSDSRENIVAACRYCNLKRHQRRKVAPTPNDFRKHVMRRLSRGAWHCSQIMERGLITVPPVLV